MSVLEVKNNTGSTIQSGKAVYLKGLDSSGSRLVGIADCRYDYSMPCIGIAMSNISNGSTGKIKDFGAISYDTDTSNVNSAVYVGQSGSLIFDDPIDLDPSYISQKVGLVLVVGDSTSGQIHLSSFDIIRKHSNQHSSGKKDEVSHKNIADISNSIDHNKYALLDGSRSFTGAIGGINPTSNNHLATKSYVDNHISIIGDGGDGYICFFAGNNKIAGDNDLYWDRANNKLGIGTSIVPVGGIGAAKMALHGIDNDAANGPFVQITTDADNYPLMQIRALRHDNIQITFDNYIDSSSTRISSNTTAFGIRKANDLFSIFANGGLTPGSSFTASNALTISSIGIVSVVGNLNVGGNITNSALTDTIKTIRKDLDGYTTSTGSTGDGYVAFFTGTNKIAGDNDFYWDRANNRLIIGGNAELHLGQAFGTQIFRDQSTGVVNFWNYGTGGIGFDQVGAGPISFNTTNILRMRIDSDGKVGIGTSTIPHNGVGAAMLALDGANADIDGPHVQFTTASDNYPLLQFLNYSHDNIQMLFDASYDFVNTLASDTSSFRICKIGDLFRIDSAGNLTAGNAFSYTASTTLNSDGYMAIGSSTNTYRLNVRTEHKSGWAAIFQNIRNTEDCWGIKVQCGRNDQTGTATNYYFTATDGDGTDEGYLTVISGIFGITQASDERKKTEIKDTQVNALDVINKIPVREFYRTKNGLRGSFRKAGFIAQELQTAIPEMVVPTLDGYLGVMDTFLMPYLVKALQELSEEVKELKKK